MAKITKKVEVTIKTADKKYCSVNCPMGSGSQCLLYQKWLDPNWNNSKQYRRKKCLDTFGKG